MSFLGSCLVLLIVAVVLLFLFPFLDIGYDKIKQHFDNEDERKEEENHDKKTNERN